MSQLVSAENILLLVPFRTAFYPLWPPHADVLREMPNKALRRNIETLSAMVTWTMHG